MFNAYYRREWDNKLAIRIFSAPNMETATLIACNYQIGFILCSLIEL